MAKDKKAAKELTMEEKLAQAFVPVEEQPYKIPENWCWVYLTGGFAECLDSFRKPINATERVSRNGDIPYYGATGQVGWINDFLTDEQLVLVGEDGAPFLDLLKDKAYIIKGKAWVNNHAHVLRSYFGNIGNYYLLHYLNCFDYTNYVNGTTRLKLTQANMNRIPVPLSPLKEQGRIVDRIESIFSKLDEAKEKAQAVVDGFELRKSAILHKAFTGELTKQWREKQGLTLKSWKHKKFSEICDVVRGGSPRPAGNPKFYGGSIPFMKVADITQNNSPFVSSTKHTIKEEGLKKTRMVAPNTLLLTNSGATLGVPAITLIQTTFNDGIAAFLNLKSDNLLFYYYFWMSKTNELRGINKGAAQPNLNTDIIGAIEIDIPKEDEQTQIVMILKYLIGKEEQVKEAAESVIEKIETMKKTVLACAFRGKLGTNDLSEVKAVEVLKQVL